MRNYRYLAVPVLHVCLGLGLMLDVETVWARKVVSRELSARDVARLRVGQRSEDVLRQLGPPLEYPRWLDGTRSLVYSVNLPGNPAARLYVDVSEDGRVLDVQYGVDEEN